MHLSIDAMNFFRVWLSHSWTLPKFFWIIHPHL
jgi:hypothetical protein